MSHKAYPVVLVLKPMLWLQTPVCTASMQRGVGCKQRSLCMLTLTPRVFPLISAMCSVLPHGPHTCPQQIPGPCLIGSAPHRKVNGVGPGLIFAKELLSLQQSPGSQIGLVPCANGGSSIDEWLPGTVLFQQMVDMFASHLLDS